MKCRHENFLSSVTVNRADSGRFVAVVKVKCADCGEQFQFFGLPPAVPKANLNGASVSKDKMEAYLAVGTPETLMNYYGQNAEQVLKEKRML